MLQVCTSASSTDGALTTTANLRLLLGEAASTSTNEVYYQSLIVRASRWLEQRLGYPPLAQTYLETVPAYGGQNLMLSRTPIRTVLRFFDSTSTDSATEYCSTDYRLEDADAGFLSRDAGFSWTAGERYYLGKTIVANSELKPWMVEYIAGWQAVDTATTGANYSTAGVYGATSTVRDFPEDLEQAVLLKAAEFARPVPASGVQSESVGDLSRTYFGKGNYRSEAEDLLAPYRRMA
jgi:hypothetical protein